MSALADARARQLAVSEFVRPVTIEAGAGTGKTRTLVARIGTWLLAEGWETARAELAAERAARGDSAAVRADEIAARACEGVVAITFTDAAASEMGGRVDRLLGQAASRQKMQDLDPPPLAADPDERARRAEALLASSSRLRISTIHGFCHRLLAEAPLDAGLHPGFEVDADGERAAELATSILLARLRGGDPNLVELLAAGVDPPALLEALTALAAAGVRADELSPDPFDDATLSPRFAALAAALERLLELAAPLGAGKRVASIDDGLAALGSLLMAIREVAPTADGLIALAPELEASGSAKKILVDWAGGRFGATEEKQIADLAALAAAAGEVARRRADLAELDPAFLRLARRALLEPLAELTARQRAQGVVSFDDLLDRAARLLGERAGVRARVRRGMRQLLVDEFQDTDGRQCELLRALVLAESEAPRPGLFVVGDPKQSIYGWRSADLAAYSGFLRELADAGGLADRLEVNFRSAPAILAEVERALAPILVEEPGIQAPFQPLRPSPARENDRGFETADRAPVEYWASWDADGAGATSAARATEIEAEAIARDVRELVEAGAATWSHFALLLRARGDLDVYLDAFRRAGVPYVVQKDRSYYRRREVVDAAAAVRAILDPDDLLATVAFLRSPFVGVPDFAWLPLWRAGFPAALIAADGERGLDVALAAVRTAAAERPTGLPAAARAGAVSAWADSLVGAVESIAALRAEFRVLPVAAWIERLRARLLFEPIAAARFLGRFGLANLERLFAELEERLGAEADPARALAALRLAVAEEAPAEEARPPEERIDALAVMTIHTAKGLEFRHVYLAQAQRQAGGPAGRALPGVAIGPAAAPREMTLFASPTPGWRELDARRRRVSAGEAARLLYVATTRAVDRLVLCGRWSENPEAPKRSDAVPSFAELLAGRLADAPELSPAAPARRDAHDVLWRAPAFEARGDAEIGKPPEAPATSAAQRERLARDLVELRALREAAAARAARPRFLRASQLAAFEPDRDPELPPTDGTREVELEPFADPTAPGGPTNSAKGRTRQGKGALKGKGQRPGRESILGAETDQAAAAGGSGGAGSRGDSAASRALARARGVAIHHALELQPLALQDEEAWRRTVRSTFVSARPSASADELAALDAQLANLKSSLLWKQLSSVSDEPSRVLARELPLLVSVVPDAKGELTPTDGYVGTLDLLYSDPETDELVVADFKTDLVEGDDGVAELVERYRPQLELYGRAVRAALDLKAAPRLELWLTELDRIVPVAPAARR